MLRSKSTEIPGPAGWLGLDARAALRLRPVEWCENLHQTFGNVVRYRVFGKSFIQVSDPGLVRKLSELPAGRLVRTWQSAAYSIPGWQSRLSVLVEKYGVALPEIPELTFDRFTVAVSRRIKSRLKQESVRIFNVSELFFDIGLQPLAEVLLGPGVDHVLPSIENLVRELNRIGRVSYTVRQRIVRTSGESALPWLEREHILQIRHGLQTSQKRVPADWSNASLIDFLLLLKNSSGKGKNLSDEFVLEIALAGLVQALHSLVHVASRALYLLATHQVEQLAVQSEILENGRRSPASVAKCHGPELVECVLLEAAKLFPPCGLIALEAPDSVQAGRLVIPGKSIYIIPVWISNRNEELFPTPGVFLLSRFGEPAEGIGPGMIPFGLGPEEPFLRKFAMIGAAAGLRAILESWQLELIELQDKQGFLPVIPEGFLHGPYIQFRRRR